MKMAKQSSADALYLRPVMKAIFTNPGIRFIVVFLSLFLIFNYGTQFWEGVCAPGGAIYSPFFEKYANYIGWLRSLILWGSHFVASAMGMDTIVIQPYFLRIVNGSGVQMVYSCIGIGVMSFWAAFIIANNGKLLNKLVWAFGGLFAIYLINCFRVAILLKIAAQKGNINSFGEHHTVFNVVAYGLVFGLMYWYGRKKKDDR